MQPLLIQPRVMKQNTFTVNFHVLLNFAYNLKALKSVILFFKTEVCKSNCI